MGYYEYEVRAAHSWRFIGDTPKDIAGGLAALNAMRSPDDLVPSGCINPLERVEIDFVFPCSTRKFVACEIAPGFIVHVNSNAFDYVRHLKDAPGTVRFGPLYGFQNTHLHFSFIPLRIANALFEYNWTPHIAEMDQDFAGREATLDSSTSKGLWVRLGQDI